MNDIVITLENPELSLDQPVMVDKPECSFALEFTTMKGEIRRRAAEFSTNRPNDRDSLPISPTLKDVVLLAIKRQHPVLQYVAEQNGVRVIGYFERRSFHQMMSCIEYGPNGAAIRIVP